jgi:PAS domain S-box-containing protein
MGTFIPDIDRPFTVRGTKIGADDTPAQFLQKLARIALDEMFELVAVLNTDGILVECNRTALVAGGLSRTDVIAKPFWESFWWTVTPKTQEELRDAIRRAAAGEFVRYDVEVYGGKRAGKTVVLDFTLSPVRDETGRIVLLLAEGRDITEKKARESELTREREEQAQLDEQKTQFFADISHEFRTPLTLMLGPIDDALTSTEDPLGLKQRERILMSQRNGLHLQKLVNTLLDFSRVEAGRVQAVYQASDLAGLTRELASSFHTACEKAGLLLTVDAQKLPEPVFVDHQMWEKIVLNLVSNAFKFTLKGEIKVTVRAEGDRAVLRVTDTGIGISESQLPRIFERFHRVEGAHGRTEEGSGIGLALVQELVKLHKGSIDVDSEPGRGTTFTVRLPFGQTHLPAVPGDGKQPLNSTASRAETFVTEAMQWLPGADQAAEPAPLSPLPAARARILLAEDNADMRAYITRLLGARFEITALPDGEAALESAQAHPPDLILSDVMMPRVDGFSLLLAVRTDPRLREIPVILLSARAGEENRVEGIEAGADDYLVKPFSARELSARVETQVNMSRMRQDARAVLQESEYRFRTFANTAPAMLWTTEPDASCSFFSRGWYEYTGQSSEAALGAGWLDAVHPDDRENARTALVEANDRQEAFSIDYRLRRVDGEFRWALNTCRPRFNPEGAFLGYTCAVIDVHERKEAERSSALLSAIVDNCDDAIISKDLNGIITSWNRGAERIFGYTAEEAVGRSIALLIPPERLDEEPEILSKLRRGERMDHFETIRVRKDGIRLNISLTISPIKGADGRIIGASKVARDITERVRNEEALREANAALKRANADLQQFAYSASHDLQEPLRMVVAYSELLQERFSGMLGPTGDEYIGHTVDGAIRMENLLRDLRTYTQITATEYAPTGNIDAGQILGRALQNLEIAIQESGANVTSTQLPSLRMYEFQLEQIFQNLIGNAIRYSGDRKPQIHIAAVPQGNHWVFAVKDNGIGIEPEYKEQIFGIFKRLHSAAEYPGTGMGLAICQRIIERAGGRIWVESEPGRGSTFYFTLPAGEPVRDGLDPSIAIDSADRGQSGGCGISA